MRFNKLNLLRSRIGYILTLLLTCSSLSLVAQSWPAGIHDPSSIVKCKDTYWIFGTGDGIHTMYSKDMVTWQNGPTPFTKTDFPSWISKYVKGATDDDGNAIFHGAFWAPDIIYMNNKYYLYYSCSEWGTMTSTIGCVTNTTLDPDDPDYEWVDLGFLGIYSYQPGLALNAIDAALMRGHDGKIWLTYGSFNSMGIVVTEVDSITGKPKSLPGTSVANSWTGGTRYGEGEGGCMAYHDGYYYMFYNKGGCCAGIASTYYVVVGRSRSPKGPFVDKNGVMMRRIGAKSGGTIVFKHDDSRGDDDRFYGPGHIGVYKENGIDYVTFHYYDPLGYYPNEAANNKGGPTLGLAKLEWGEDGWPSISKDFLDKGYYSLKNSNSSKYLDIKSHSTTSGNSLYQYNLSSIGFYTQQWRFTPLGTGEYTIRNYVDSTLYIEAIGTNNEESLRVTNDFQGAVNQKFRVVKSPNGKILIYPSTRNKIFEIPNAATTDYPVKLWSNTNHACQRWLATPYEEKLRLTLDSLVFNFSDTTTTELAIKSNCIWNIEVEDDSWFSVSPSSGKGNQTLTITASENEDTNERSNNFTLKSNGGTRLAIDVTQYSANYTSVNSNDLSVSVYPNPTSGLIRLSCKSKASFKLFNQFGKILLNELLDAPITTLDISDLNSGIYLMEVRNSTGIITKKIIKQ